MKIKNLLMGMLAIAAALSCEKEPVVTPEPEPDKEPVVEAVLNVSTTEVALAATAGEATFDVTANNAWTAASDAAWITLNPANGEGAEAAVAVTITAEENTATEARTATVTVTSGELTKTVTVTQAAAEPVVIGIKNADDLMAFAAAVNAGGDLTSWTVEGEVKLLADIDLTGKTWVPIGNARIDRMGDLVAEDVKPFTGVFNGDGHKVTGLTYTPDGSTLGECSTFGFFGALSGATVKNLTVEVGKIYVECPAVEFSLGGIAGAACNESTILNCTVLAANDQAMIASKQTATGDVRNSLGGIVGLVGKSTVEGCVNNCPVRVQNTFNTNNGGNSYHSGGIWGYSQGASFAKSCTNNAEIGGKVGEEFWGDSPRIGGIVGTGNSTVTIENCTNNGDVLCSIIGTGDKSSRAAGILCYVGGAGTVVKGCVNNGDVCFIREFTNGTDYVACVSGIFGQAGNTVTVEECENYGAILADTWFSVEFSVDGTANNPTMGIVTSRPNTKVVTVKNNKIGGKIGPYSDPSKVVTLTADNFAMYMFGDTAARRAKIVSEGNTFATK